MLLPASARLSRTCTQCTKPWSADKRVCIARLDVASQSLKSCLGFATWQASTALFRRLTATSGCNYLRATRTQPGSIMYTHTDNCMHIYTCLNIYTHTHRFCVVCFSCPLQTFNWTSLCFTYFTPTLSVLFFISRLLLWQQFPPGVLHAATLEPIRTCHLAICTILQQVTPQLRQELQIFASYSFKAVFKQCQVRVTK